jgi:uncharacterized membrane protein YccC
MRDDRTPHQWSPSRSPWWLVWAALAGGLAGLFASGFPWCSVTLAALIGLAFALFAWGILQDRHDKWVAVKLSEEDEPLARVRAGNEGEDW